MLIESMTGKAVQRSAAMMYLSALSTHNAAQTERTDGETQLRNIASPPPAPLLEPRAAAVSLLSEFKRLAAALSPRDPSTQDDLVQEMCLAALECTEARQRSYYLWLAGWRAKDYLRWWLTPMKRVAATDQVEEKMDE